jgi:hypothetical protein
MTDVDHGAAAGAEPVGLDRPRPASGERALLAKVGSSPFRPGALDKLFFRPREFFAANHAFNKSVYLLSMVGVIGITRAASNIAKQLTKAQLGLSTPAADLRLLHSWLTFWLMLIPLGVLWGAWTWWIGGWWYQVRLWWSGADDVPPRAARVVYAYVSLVVAIPALLVLLLDTAFHPNFRVAYDADSAWSLFTVITPFWAYVVSYRSVTVVFTLHRFSALLWFLILPIVLALGAVGLLVAMFTMVGRP